MPRALKVLIAEDNPADAELVLRQVRRAGFAPEWTRVDSEDKYLASLHTGLDIILSDYDMPQFGGIRALELLRESGLDIPLILISGTIGEDTAVAAMKEGAVDYLLKDRLTRLGTAIDHALEQSRLRRERKVAEKALRESEDRFREVVQNIEEVFWMTNAEKSEMVFVSAAYEKIWGRTCASLYASPMTWSETIHPEDRSRVLNAADTKQIDGTYHEEYRIVRPDGTIRWINDRAFPVRNADGIVHRIAGVARDITERKEAEGALKLFRTLVDQSADSFEVVDPASGRFLDVNEQGTVESGYTREEFLELRVCDLDPFITEAAWPQVAEGVRLNGLHMAEGSRRRKDGTTFPIELKAKWVQLDRGYIVAVIRDIRARRQVEERLREQGRMLDQAHEAIIVRDFQTRQITFWNQGAERLYGWSAGEAMGRNLSDLLQTSSDMRDAIGEQLLATGEWRGELRHISKNGKKLIVNCSATLVRDREGHPKSALLINIDVTEQKDLEARFLRAQRMEGIGALAGGIAHDLNNALGPVIMSLDILKLKIAEPDCLELLDIVSSSAQRGVDMVRQVLSFGRGVEGRRMDLQVKHLIQEIGKIASDTILKSIEVRTNVPHDLGTIVGDPTQLHQVLLNLCVNARDAMPDGGKLTLSAEDVLFDANYAGLNPEAHAGPYVLLQVEDTGTGIPPEVMEKIFDPFFTTKEIGKGTGLGLSTSLGIIKSHGGFVLVESEVGKGTKFQVYLPAQTEAVRGVATESTTEMPLGNNELILLIDDETSVRQITRQTLEAFGYRVVLAGDGAEAIAVFASRGGEIAAVVADMMMPVMDGPATIHVLRRMNPQVRIIAMSGLATSDRAAEMADLGVKHFLAKPFTAETLLKTLRQVLTEELSIMSPGIEGS